MKLLLPLLLLLISTNSLADFSTKTIDGETYTVFDETIERSSKRKNVALFITRAIGNDKTILYFSAYDCIANRFSLMTEDTRELVLSNMYAPPDSSIRVLSKYVCNYINGTKV